MIIPPLDLLVTAQPNFLGYMPLPAPGPGFLLTLSNDKP